MEKDMLSDIDDKTIIDRIVHSWTVDEVEGFLINWRPYHWFTVDFKIPEGQTVVCGILKAKNAINKKLDYRDEAIINLFLEHGADPLQIFRSGYGWDTHFKFSFLHEVALRGSDTLLTNCLKKVRDINVFLDNMAIPIMKPMQETPLHLVLRYGKMSSLKYVLSRKPKLNLKNSVHWDAPIHMAKSIETMRMLLDNGANIEARDIYGYTPLMNAILSRDVERTEFLLRRGANADAKYKDEGLLHLLFLPYVCDRIHPKLTELLLEYGCNPAASDKDYCTPAMKLAACKGLINKHEHEEILCEYLAQYLKKLIRSTLNKAPTSSDSSDGDEETKCNIERCLLIELAQYVALLNNQELRFLNISRDHQSVNTH